jgi:ketosteroid isomerase-like protein
MNSTPRDLFDRMAAEWLGSPAEATGDQFADGVIIEMPYAPPGARDRFEGRQDFLDHTRPQRAAFPARIDECRTVAVHETADPATIVVEYELTGTSLVNGRQSSAGFVVILTAHDGKITRWREYQNVAAIQRALG